MMSGLAMKVYLSNSSTSEPSLYDKVKISLRRAGHQCVTASVRIGPPMMRQADILLVIPPDEDDLEYWEVHVGKGQALAITDWHKCKGSYSNIYILNSCENGNLIASQLLSTAETNSGDWKTNYLQLTTDYGDIADDGRAYDGKTIAHIANIVTKRQAADKQKLLQQAATERLYRDKPVDYYPPEPTMRLPSDIIEELTAKYVPTGNQNTYQIPTVNWADYLKNVPITPQKEPTGLTVTPMLALRRR